MKQKKHEVSKTPLYFKDFLESKPPGASLLVEKVFHFHPNVYPYKWKLNYPEIELYCLDCDRKSFFKSYTDPMNYCSFNDDVIYDSFLYYLCKNCEMDSKTFVVRVRIQKIDEQLQQEGFAEVLKIGEYPSFGPPIPKRVLKWMGVYREEFLKGRRCENQGLGKGAFTYYRNIVEHQKNTLIDELISVANVLKISSENIELIKKAKQENQFSKAIERIKHFIPEPLMIKGHNPFTMLYKALSKGVHPDLSDEKCLSYATSIRVILTKLCEKMESIMKDDKDINAALKQLNS